MKQPNFLLCLSFLLVVGCGSSSPTESPGQILTKDLGENHWPSHHAIRVLPLIGHEKLMPSVATILRLNARTIHLDAPIRLLSVQSVIPNDYAFDVILKGPEFNLTRHFEAPGKAESDAPANEKEVSIKIADWKYVAPQPLTEISVMGGEAHDFTETYHFHSATMDFDRIRHSHELANVLRLYIQTKVDISDRLQQAGYLPSSIESSIDKVWQDLSRLSDKELLTMMISSEYTGLLKESRLQEAIRLYCLQYVVCPEWTISLKIDGRDIIAYKDLRSSSGGGFTAFFYEFDEHGMLWSHGRIGKNKFSPQELADEITTAFGELMFPTQR